MRKGGRALDRQRLTTARTGTTSCCVLAAELLREAERLVTTSRVRPPARPIRPASDERWQIHPQTVVEGYRIASNVALKALEGHAFDNSYAILPLRRHGRLRRDAEQKGRGRVQEGSRQHCQDDALVKGLVRGQGLLCQPRRRRRSPIKGASIRRAVLRGSN